MKRVALGKIKALLFIATFMSPLLVATATAQRICQYHFYGDLGPGQYRNHELGYLIETSLVKAHVFWNPGSSTVRLALYDHGTGELYDPRDRTGGSTYEEWIVPYYSYWSFYIRNLGPDSIHYDAYVEIIYEK